MDELSLLHNYLVVGAMLFGIGMIGLVSRRNLIIAFLSAEMMLQGVSVSLVAWGRFHNDWGGQILTIFALTVAACEAAIALALVMMLFQRSGTLDLAYWQRFREESLPAFVDREIPEETIEEQEWPELTPSGLRPAHDPTKETHRSYV
jgi:NADH-quinone oxidoreductase subunit K